MTDLTFIEDGIPSVIKKTHLINFAKRMKTADVIRDIQQYQNVAYSLQPVPELQDYILSNMQAAGDVHEMYDKSLLIEPREREDENIVRYKSFHPDPSPPPPLLSLLPDSRPLLAVFKKLFCLGLLVLFLSSFSPLAGFTLLLLNGSFSYFFTLSGTSKSFTALTNYKLQSLGRVRFPMR